MCGDVNSSSSDAKSDLGGMRGEDGTENAYGDRFGSNGQVSDGRVSDISTQYDGIEKSYSASDLAGLEDDLADSRHAMEAIGLSRSSYADVDTENDSLTDAEKESDLANRDRLTEQAIADAITSRNQANPGYAAAPGVDGLEDDRTLSDKQMSDLRDSYSSEKENGVWGTVANFASSVASGIGSLVNGAIDAFQANDFNETQFGESMTLGELAKTGIKSAAKDALATAAGGFAGGVVGSAMGPSTGLVGYAASLGANKAVSDTVKGFNGFDSSPNATAGVTAGANGTTNAGLLSSSLQSTTETPDAGITTGYNSSFGNYDSHLNNFSYGSQTALDAWTV